MNYENTIKFMEKELGELDKDDLQVARASAKFDYNMDLVGRLF